MVYGALERSVEHEEFVVLDARGEPRCQENTRGFLDRIEPKAGELWFHGLFDGQAIYEHNVGSTNRMYAFVPCRPAVALGWCDPGEWLESEGGPLCLNARQFRLLGSELSGTRLGPSDKGYSATRDGVLRVLLESEESLVLRWNATEHKATWTARIALAKPMTQVVRAAGNVRGAAVWLSSSGQAGKAALVIATRNGLHRQFEFDVETQDFLAVAVSEQSWAATIPPSHAANTGNEGGSKQCWLGVGTFDALTNNPLP